MLAIGLTIALFAFWSVLGYAVIRAVGARLEPLQEVLLAPVIGVVVTTIPLFALNSFGLPISRFAYPLTIVLLVASCAPLLVARPRLPVREWWPFGITLLVALLVVGWPLLEYGFDWVSLCNDDMANYCLGAARFYQHGFFDAPPAEELVGGQDYSQYYWFLHVPAMVRPGVELLLAWVMGVSHLTPHEIFMPTIVAFHLCQVSALGALVAQSREMRWPAVAACAMLSLSALATFGVMYQLIAQVLGMALVAGAAAVLLRPYHEPGTGPLLRRGILAGIIGAGLFLLYPEVIPIVGGAWLVYLVGEALRGRLRPRAVGVFVGVALVVTLGLLGRQAIGIAGFLFYQTSVGSSGGGDRDLVFPFYQLPSGIADFWGYFPLAFVPPEPYASSAILLGAVLLAVALAATAWMFRRHQPVAVVAALMFTLTAYLFLRHAYFGLYKIAMFLQPFVLGTIAIAVFALLKRPSARLAVLALFALPGLNVQQTYVRDSRGTGAAGGFPEIVDPSRSRINDEFRRFLDKHAEAAAAGGIVCDTPNIVLGKFQSYFTRGYETAYPSALVGTSMLHFEPERSLAPTPILETAVSLQRAVTGRMEPNHFQLHDPNDPGALNGFRYQPLGPLARRTPASPEPNAPHAAPASQPATADPLLISPGPKQSVLNRWGGGWRSRPGADAVNFVARPLSRARDHLVFVESDLGRSYYLAHRNVAFYQLEPDPLFFRGETMAGMGRRILFEVLEPSPGVRLVVELTSSLSADANNLLPSAADVIAAERSSLGLAGRGSARVFTAPLTPQQIDGRWFVALDLGRDAVPFRQPRRGLMRLYGLNVSLDRRWLVCFARNISAVSERQYAAMNPPSRIDHFPEALKDMHLAYSGIYEDGWTSEQAWATLTQPWDADALLIRGSVPDLGDAEFQTEMTLRVGGVEVARQTLGVGQLEVRVPLPQGLSQPAGESGLAADAPRPRRKVELNFSRTQRLTDPDRRPVACLLTSFGFESRPAPPVALQNFPEDVDRNPLLAAAGFYPDGWAAPRTSLRLSQPPGHGILSLRGEVPLIGDGNFATELRVRVDGQQVAAQTLQVGTFELAAPLSDAASQSPGPRQVELQFSNSQQLPRGDGRSVGARLAFIGFAPDPQPPARIERFPDDLRNTEVRATGVSDDGWAGPTASFQLLQPPGAEVLTVSGMVPKIGDADGFTTEVAVTVDGQEVARKTLGLDRFAIDAPVPPPAAPSSSTNGEIRRVGLTFSQVQSLPAPDGRSVGAKLISVGFDAPGE